MDEENLGESSTEGQAKLRERMVTEQLIARGIKDERVLAAMRKVPRHCFVPNESVENTYGDYPMSIGYGQTISQPYMVAVMTERLLLRGEERVLEIGTGTGYQSAVLAELAKEVFSIDRLSILAESARTLLEELEYKNIRIKSGDGTCGWPEFSPYDAIIVTAGTPSIPKPLVVQLREGGRMILPVGGNFSQVLTLVEKCKGKVKEVEFCGCVFVPLVGKYGWQE